MKSAFGPTWGSSGDSHAIVTQLARIVSKITWSNNFASTMKIAGRRGQVAGLKQQRERPA